MTPQEKAKELVTKYKGFGMYNESIAAKQCALIAVDEILSVAWLDYPIAKYWLEVKQEIEKL